MIDYSCFLCSSAEDSIPSACKFLFEEVTPSSVVIILIELLKSSVIDNVKGYKLWYFKSRDETHSNEPHCVFPRAQRRIVISNLQPCTEYTFRIISYADAGDVGHSEAKCFTKSVELMQKVPDLGSKKPSGPARTSPKSSSEEPGSCSEFKVRDLGKILHLAWAQEQGQQFEGFCSAAPMSKTVKPETVQEEERLPSARGLDLNVASVPDLNEELTPPFESSREEDDSASHDVLKNNDGLARSHGSGDSQTWTRRPAGEVPAVDSRTEFSRKRALADEAHDCDSTLINGSSPIRISNGACRSLDENFEYCVKIIRWLECEGHLAQEFRLKLLTWFSLRSTEQERRVVNTFIQTMIDDPSSLAGQLVDSFTDIISSKRQKNGFCSKLWH